LEAGFTRTQGHAVAAEHYGTLAETRRFAAVVSGLFRNPDLAGIAIDQGWATQGDIDEFVRWIEQWGEREDAFFAVMYCAAIGWA